MASLASAPPSFSSSALSRHSRVSEKLTSKISAGEYVSIASLLHDSSPQSYSVSIRPGGDRETPMFSVTRDTRYKKLYLTSVCIQKGKHCLDSNATTPYFKNDQKQTAQSSGAAAEKTRDAGVNVGPAASTVRLSGSRNMYTLHVTLLASAENAARRITSRRNLNIKLP